MPTTCGAQLAACIAHAMLLCYTLGFVSDCLPTLAAKSVPTSGRLRDWLFGEASTGCSPVGASDGVDAHNGLTWPWCYSSLKV